MASQGPLSVAGGRSTAQRATRGIASLTGARAVAFVLQFVTFGVLASHLGPHGFGVYTFGVAFAGLFGTVANFGFKQVVTRDAAQHPEDEAWLLPNFLYLRLVLGLLGYLVLAVGLRVIGYGGDERRAALVAGTLLVLMAVGSFSAALEVRLRLGWVALADIAESLVLFVSVFVLTAADAGVLAFLWAFVAVNVLNGIMVLVAALRITSFDWRPHPSRWIPLARAAAPLGLAGIFGAIAWQVDIALLTRLKPLVDVGQYGVAYRFLEAIAILPAMMMVALNPVFSKSVVDSAGALQRRFGVAAHLLALLALPLSVLGAMTAWRLLPGLPGFGAYGRGGIVLSVLSVAAGLIFAGTLVQGLLISGHRQRRLLAITAGGAILNLVLNLVLIPRFSVYGAASATAFSEVVVLCLSIDAVRRLLDVRWPVHRLRPALKATAAMAVVAAMGYVLPPIVQAVLATVAYLVASFAFGSFRWSDLGGLLRREGPHVRLDEGSSLGLRRSRAASMGGARCTVVAPRGSAWRAALGARMAGCSVVELERTEAGGAASWLTRQLFDHVVEPEFRQPV